MTDIDPIVLQHAWAVLDAAVAPGKGAANDALIVFSRAISHIEHGGRSAPLTHAQRLEGLSREDLKNLKAKIDGALADIDAAGQVDAWAVSTPWLNLHWDVSYARACLYLEKLLRKARTELAEPEVYELVAQRIWAAELPNYERDYGKQWAELQAEIDATPALECGAAK